VLEGICLTGSETRDFGSSNRESHDSSKFYSLKMYEDLQIDEKKKILDRSDLVSGSTYINDLEDLENNTVHLCIVISRKNKLVDIIPEISRSLITGGRLCFVDKSNDKNEKELYDASRKSRLYPRGEIIIVDKDDFYKCVVLSKDVYGRKKKVGGKIKTDTISRETFLSSTKSVWQFKDWLQGLIHLYSFLEDVLLIVCDDVKILKPVLSMRKKTLFLVK
jgi:hypothetical protein